MFYSHAWQVIKNAWAAKKPEAFHRTVFEKNFYVWVQQQLLVFSASTFKHFQQKCGFWSMTLSLDKAIFCIAIMESVHISHIISQRSISPCWNAFFFCVKGFSIKSCSYINRSTMPHNCTFMKNSYDTTHGKVIKG